MMNGYGMVTPWMMGPMSMGPAMEPAMMGPQMMNPEMMGWIGTGKTYLENWIAFSGNTRIKAGPVGLKNDTTIRADIVTADNNGLVERVSIGGQVCFMPHADEVCQIGQWSR